MMEESELQQSPVEGDNEKKEERDFIDKVCDPCGLVPNNLEEALAHKNKMKALKVEQETAVNTERAIRNSQEEKNEAVANEGDGDMLSNFGMDCCGNTPAPNDEVEVKEYVVGKTDNLDLEDPDEQLMKDGENISVMTDNNSHTRSLAEIAAKMDEIDLETAAEDTDGDQLVDDDDSSLKKIVDVKEWYKQPLYAGLYLFLEFIRGQTIVLTFRKVDTNVERKWTNKKSAKMELNKKFRDSLDLGRTAGAARFKKIENVQQILWIQNNQIPPFYIEVLQYVSCTTSGQAIDPNLLFPLLVCSRLPQDVLGQIWSVCNQTFPGQLTLQEFFAAMALVAIRQQNNSAQISLQAIADFPCVPNFFNFDLSQRPEPVQQSQQQASSHKIQEPIVDDLEDDDEFGDFAESTGELQASYAPTIKSFDIVTPIDSFHKERANHEIKITENTQSYGNNQEKKEDKVNTASIQVVPVQPEFSFPVSAPVPSGFVDQAQIDPEPVSMEKRDIYAALRDIQGPSESEELPELEQPVFQAAPVNQNVGDEEDDDFGDFEEAKEIAISEQIQNQNFKKPAIPKVLSLDIQKFEKIARDTPSPSEPVYDPFALSFNAGEKQISQMAKTMSSDFDLLAGLDFGTPSEPVQPIEAPTTEDRLAQVLSLDLPDLQETQNRSVNEDDEEIKEENEEISSPENENMPSWDIITNNEVESKSRSESECPSVSVDHSEVQENEPVEEKSAPAAPIHEQKSTKVPKRRSLLSKAEPVWKKLLKECFRVVRITHDVFKGAEPKIITEILLAKEGQDYLANVCSIYLASYRYLSALRHFGFAVTSEMKEIDSMWESLADLVQNHSKTLELPFAKVRPITRDCKICLHKCKEDYHSICKCMYVEIIKEDLPDFRLTS